MFIPWFRNRGPLVAWLPPLRAQLKRFNFPPSYLNVTGTCLSHQKISLFLLKYSSNRRSILRGSIAATNLFFYLPYSVSRLVVDVSSQLWGLKNSFLIPVVLDYGSWKAFAFHFLIERKKMYTIWRAIILIPYSSSHFHLALLSRRKHFLLCTTRYTGYIWPCKLMNFQ